MPRVKRATFWTLLLLALLGGTELVAQIVWAYLERQAMEAVAAAGEKALRNDAINFLKEPHPVYGYRLKPGLDLQHLKTTVQGFPQREPVGVERRPGSLRLVAMGESTTMGHNVDTGNYPAHLRRLLAERTGYSRDEAEVINAGVAGWVSGQIALLAERELKDYRPDIVFLYVGWNDFQSYDPLGPPPEQSYFDQRYKSILDSPLANVPRLKSLVLLYAFLCIVFKGVPSLRPCHGHPFTRISSRSRRHIPLFDLQHGPHRGRFPGRKPECDRDGCHPGRALAQRKPGTV